MADTFPLKWPLGREVTKSWNRKDAPFSTTMGKARDELIRQLKLLGATGVVISSNVATYTRGGKEIMYADQSASKNEPGVAVYYRWNGADYALCCDKWRTVTDNLQALQKTVDAIRGIERWGSGEMLKAAFAGFKELPTQEAKVNKRSCWEVLGIGPTKNINVIHSAYRIKAQIRHPDNKRSGSHEAFIELQSAYEEAKEQCG